MTSKLFTTWKIAESEIKWLECVSCFACKIVLPRGWGSELFGINEFMAKEWVVTLALQVCTLCLQCSEANRGKYEWNAELAIESAALVLEQWNFDTIILY